MSKSMKELARRYALQNAVFYNGKATAGAVLGKVLGSSPDLRQRANEVRVAVDEAVAEVNAMDPERQKALLKKNGPALLKKEVKKKEGLPEIPGAVKSKFVTRFAPSPTGPLNLGQLLRAAMLPYLYSKKYSGRFVLRIEDTDAKNIGMEFYGMIMEDLLSAGIKWDVLVKESDHMEDYYMHAEKLIKSGAAYVCSCPAEDFRKAKEEKRECSCRSGDSSLREWKRMLSGGYAEGGAIVRMKTSMSHKNPAMRDPPMLRVTDAPHPILKGKYRVWPLYNFACAIEDHNQGVTHVFRGKEHEHNTAVQKLFYDAFGWKQPHVVNFGMVYLPGTKVHTRDMKQWIAEGKVEGWDDPRLPTVRALIRRGFQAETLRKFAEDVGITKNDIRVGWENIFGINRKVIDPLANRFMAVIDPVRTEVHGAPVIKGALEDVHPDFPARGKRRMPVDLHRVYVSGEDFRRLKGKTVRLKGLCNVKLSEKSEYEGADIVSSMPKIQWVSAPNVGLSLMTPEGELKGLGESNLSKLKPGTLVQLERVGFARVDSSSPKKAVLYLAHR